MSNIDMHDVVALKSSMTAQRFPAGDEIFLPEGLVGTVVEIYEQGEAYEVEFAGDDGEAFAMETLKPEQLFVLHFDLPTTQIEKQRASRIPAPPHSDVPANVMPSRTGTAENLAESSITGQSLRQ